MAYIFDTNIFIRSKNEMPMEVWPTFWKKMAEMINSGQVRSSIEVKAEIDKGNDELTTWIHDNAPDSFYYAIDGEVLAKYAATQNWAQANPVFNDNARQEFATVADAYLVATAAAKGLTLVTYETSDPYCKRRVKIPDACNAIGVRSCDLNIALREMGVTI